MQLNQLANAIVEELVAYDREVAKKMQRATRKVANDTVKELRSTSPVNTGAYAAGWKVRKEGTGYRIYNATSYQLTHLLEFGHAKVNGGRVPPVKVHIKPAELKAIDELETEIKKVVQE
ncbi:HK97 gp10 family phage protein [Rummeliibacillus stabekisii]|uniref:HK97 gp10 family phage protein n=1 Tax=Rummeliibacillus stabekisii TaxID=241244 RepID=UPI0037226994